MIRMYNHMGECKNVLISGEYGNGQMQYCTLLLALRAYIPPALVLAAATSGPSLIPSLGLTRIGGVLAACGLAGTLISRLST